MKLKLMPAAFALAVMITGCGGSKMSTEKLDISLKSVVGSNFLMGVAVNTNEAAGKDQCALKVITRNFNSIVAENCMKSEEIHPEENRYYFKDADEFVKFGMKNNMAVIGHCLIWHSQLPKWFCYDNKGNLVTPDVLKKHMKDHIYTLVKRYKGKIKGWDVVNEAIGSKGTWRDTPFYKILGEEYIPLAFQYAHEADPNVELYYNDYGMDNSDKRNKTIEIVKMLKDRGLRIDAVGMQGHMGMDYPNINDFEKSMLAFSEQGVKVMITEWDMSALPTISKSANVSDTYEYQKELNPYPNGLPDSLSNAWNKRMRMFFDLFMKHSDIISRVTVWGVNDGGSWKNDYPVKGRVEYPLLFDRNCEPKPFVRKLMGE